MKTNTRVWIGLALLALAGCGREPYVTGDADELRHRSEAAPAWDAATGGEATWGDRLWAAEAQPAPLTVNWQAKLQA